MSAKSPRVLVVGAGAMAVHYARVLDALDVTPVVLGRGAASAAAFAAETGLTAGTGPLSDQMDALKDTPDTAIVTVNARYLAAVTTDLIARGVRRLLVEKPAALDLAEMAALLSCARDHGAEVYVAYNRRFLASVLKAGEIVRADGGVVSVRFDFSEPARRIAAMNKPERELRTWFYGNSTHVVDLAFHFFGPPATLEATVSGAGGVDWHPQAGVFAGYGHNTQGGLIAWHSNWVSPGRWGVEVLTAEHRLILQPLEKLRVQRHDSFAEIDIPLEDADDQAFKPGLLRQTRAFLGGEGQEHLIGLETHAENMTWYEAVRTGASFPHIPHE